jgi:hypothetical protein
MRCRLPFPLGLGTLAFLAVLAPATARADIIGLHGFYNNVSASPTALVDADGSPGHPAVSVFYLINPAMLTAAPPGSTFDNITPIGVELDSFDPATMLFDLTLFKPPLPPTNNSADVTTNGGKVSTFDFVGTATGAEVPGSTDFFIRSKVSLVAPPGDPMLAPFLSGGEFAAHVSNITLIPPVGMNPPTAEFKANTASAEFAFLAVPEPASLVTWALVAGGAVALRAWRRRLRA